MCQIRVIFKTVESGILKDKVFQFDKLEISPVDRPSYVTCVISEEDTLMECYFINEDITYVDVHFNDHLNFTYGQSSGRIKTLTTNLEKFYETTVYGVKQRFLQGTSIRVSKNVFEYLKLFGYILEIISNSLVFKEEANESLSIFNDEQT